MAVPHHCACGVSGTACIGSGVIGDEVGLDRGHLRVFCSSSARFFSIRSRMTSDTLGRPPSRLARPTATRRRSARSASGVWMAVVALAPPSPGSQGYGFVSSASSLSFLMRGTFAAVRQKIHLLGRRNLPNHLASSDILPLTHPSSALVAGVLCYGSASGASRSPGSGVHPPPASWSSVVRVRRMAASTCCRAASRSL